MLSFVPLSEKSYDTLLSDGECAFGVSDELPGYLDAFLELSLECEVALAFGSGCLLVRIFDEGRYSFVYPLDISPDADITEALLSLADYARRELIPIFLTDVPREELTRLTSTFSHVDARAYDEDEDGFVACINSECDRLPAVPTVSGEGIILSELEMSDAEDYKRLTFDRKLNKYWGYDAEKDTPNASGEELIDLARSEFSRGVALTLAIRELCPTGPRFVGEAVIFDYDYRGTAELALRILPEYHGEGRGTRALSTLITLARDMGIKTIRARVQAENIPSIKMIEKQLKRLEAKDETVYFELTL